MAYVDGFVIPVPKANKEAYRAVAKIGYALFMEYGALEVVECWADDVPTGKTTDFYMAVKCEPDETVVFSWVKWPSRQVRDAGNARMMDDPRFANMGMPFDGKRLIFGGFEVLDLG